MNKFIELRKQDVNSKDLNQFSLSFLKEYKQVSNTNDENEKDLLNLLTTLLNLNEKSRLDMNEMIALFFYLGKNAVSDRYIANLYMKNQQMFFNEEFQKKIIDFILDDKTLDSSMYLLIDSCIESNANVISDKILRQLLNKKAHNLDLFSLLIDYLYQFKITGFESSIYQWLKEGYPLNIKIQLIDLLVALHSVTILDQIDFTTIPEFQTNKKLFNDYMEILYEKSSLKQQALTVVQSMFYGDFENSGKGNNGGIAVFLKTLGNELSKLRDDVTVVTLTITNRWAANQSLLNYYSPHHLFLRIPMYIDKKDRNAFLKKERLIKRTIERYLNKLGIKPDIFHVRYLDNASKAIALLSKKLDKKLVMTLTPDPHRNMTLEDGSLEVFPLNEFIEKLNKIVVGDELIDQSDRIVGIGNQTVQKDLELYFPQLLVGNKIDTVKMISEGIETDETSLSKEAETLNLPPNLFEKPIILNVGRLEKIKSQDQLLKAWGNSSISDDYNLVVIGGDLENPSSDEKIMIDTFENYLSENEHLRANFCHIGALSNDKVRIIEKNMIEKQTDLPQIYLCSSKKEEFGIAILEALSQGFLVLGPKKGGVKSYLHSDENGFLIDTRNWQTIAKETEMIIQGIKNHEIAFEKIQAAGQKTVRDYFSMNVISKEFLSLYTSLKGSEANDR